MDSEVEPGAMRVRQLAHAPVYPCQSEHCSAFSDKSGKNEVLDGKDRTMSYNKVAHGHTNARVGQIAQVHVCRNQQVFLKSSLRFVSVLNKQNNPIIYYMESN